MQLTQTLAGGTCWTLWYPLQVNQVPSNVGKFTFLLAECVYAPPSGSDGWDPTGNTPPHRHHCTALCVVPDLSLSLVSQPVGVSSHTLGPVLTNISSTYLLPGNTDLSFLDSVLVS